MKRLARHLIRFYPASWRQRYGEEFEALLEDSSPGVGGILDLMKGALKMRLTLPSFPKLALLLLVAGILTGLGVSFLVTPLYVSRATLLFESAPGFSQTSLRADMTPVPQVLSRNSLFSVIKTLNLYPEERARMPLENVIEQMRTRDIGISTVAMGPVALTISFAYRDRQKAQDTVEAIISKFIEANLKHAVAVARPTDEFARIEARLAAIEKRVGAPSPAPAPSDPLTTVGGTQVEVLDPPSFPVRAIYPNRLIFGLYGSVSGFVLAALIAIFRRRVQPAVPFPATTA